MTASLEILRAAPLTSIQDGGRTGALRYGVAASGPMDRGGFAQAGAMLTAAGSSGIEFTASGLAILLRTGECHVGMGGGCFRAARDGTSLDWPGAVALKAGETLRIDPGPSGNYGYLRFSAEIDVPAIMGSRATNLRNGIGGLDGRALRARDILALAAIEPAGQGDRAPGGPAIDKPIRFLWGLHADHFPAALRQQFRDADFRISPRLDRMGVVLEDPERVFAGASRLSLVSDAVVAGDIQIVGDGTATVLMRDHQPTGGYPRIGTVIEADLDRFAQMRPGTPLQFESVSLAHAHALRRRR